MFKRELDWQEKSMKENLDKFKIRLDNSLKDYEIKSKDPYQLQIFIHSALTLYTSNKHNYVKIEKEYNDYVIKKEKEFKINHPIKSFISKFINF